MSFFGWLPGKGFRAHCVGTICIATEQRQGDTMHLGAGRQTQRERKQACRKQGCEVKVYIAASLAMHGLAHQIQWCLLDQKDGDYEIVSRWHEPETLEDCKRIADMGETGARAVAEMNLADLRRADVFLLLPDDECRGALVELGYALGRGIGVVVAGCPPTLMARGEHAVVLPPWSFMLGPDINDIVAGLRKAYGSRGAK